METNTDDLLNRALDACGGSPSALGRELGVAHNLVSYWKANGLPKGRRKQVQDMLERIKEQPTEGISG